MEAVKMAVKNKRKTDLYENTILHTENCQVTRWGRYMCPDPPLTPKKKKFLYSYISKNGENKIKP